MRSFVIICCLSIACAKSGAQPDYINYHKEIIHAEQFFLKKDLEGSLKKYQQIFSVYNKPFAKDCFIALQIACLRYDTANASYFFEKCFQRGVHWEALKSVPQIFNMLRDTYPYDKRIKELYESARKKYLSSIDMGLRKTVIAMLMNDHSHKAGGRDSIRGPIYTDVLDDNIRRLDSICKKTGYPGEKKIGIWDHEVYEDGSHRYSTFLSSLPSIMYYHHYCGYRIMCKELMNAVKNGELQPKEYALIYEWSYAYQKRKKFADDNAEKYSRYLRSYNFYDFKLVCDHEDQTKYYNVYIDRSRHSPDTTFVNKCRNEIGIASLEHEKQKRQFAAKYQLKFFFGMFENL
jgi:hypothetical protein